MKRIIFILFVLMSFCAVNAQTTYPTFLPSPKGDSALAQYGYVWPKTLLLLPNRDTAIRPKYPSLVYWPHAGVDSTLWIYDMRHWKQVTGTGGGGTVVWGDITGDIHNQTDLINYIDSVVNAGGGGSTEYVVQGYGIKVDSALRVYTVRVDSSVIASKTWFYNRIDSLVLTFNSRYVKYTDTSTMLANYPVGGRINWPGTIYSTPTTATVTSKVLTFAPTLANQSAWTVFARNAGTSGTPSFGQLKAEHLNTTYSNGNMLITDGSGNLSWTSAGGSGTVTSVAATAASGMTVTGSPIVNSGTLAFAWTGAVQGDVPYFSGTNTISFLNKSTTANQFLKNSGTNNNPAWATIAASDIGSGAALTKVDDTNVTLTLGGSPSTALLAATSMTLGWSGVLGVSRGGTSFGSYTTGDMLYASGSGTLSKLSIGTSKQHLVVVGGVPAWVDTAVVGGSGVTTWSAGTTGFTPNSATSGAVTLAGVLVEANGGTHQSTYTTGDMLYASASNTLSKLPIGTNGQHLIVSGGVPTWRDSLANNSWLLTGNASTSYATNFIGTTDNVSWRIRTNNTERAIMDSVGFMGIGTSSPVTKLHVLGAGRPNFGAEILDNTGWTSTNWTGSWSTGWTHTTGNTSVLSRTGAATVGTLYRIGYVITSSAGTVTIGYAGSGTLALSGNVTGEIGFAGLTTAGLTLTPTSTFNGTIFITLETVAAGTPISTFRSNNGGKLDFYVDSTLGNMGVGEEALSKVFGSNNTGTVGSNTAVGYRALRSNVQGTNNTAFGTNALLTTAVKAHSTAIGANALVIAEGNFNTGVGSGVFSTVAAGQNNTGVGYSAGNGVTSGNENVVVGASSVLGNGSNRTVVGAILAGAPGANTTYVGHGQLNSIALFPTGANNTTVGSGSMAVKSASSAFDNTSMGFNVFENFTGSQSVGLGAYAGDGNAQGASNFTNASTNDVYVGYKADYDNTQNHSGDGNTIVGAFAKKLTITGSNQLGLFVGGASAWPVIYKFTTDNILINVAKTTTPTATTSAGLEINGTAGGLLIPRLTTTQRNAVSSPATGLKLFNTTLNYPEYYDGATWQGQVGMTFGTAAPASTPSAVGNFYLDTTNKKLYVSTGTASSADWNILN